MSGVDGSGVDGTGVDGTGVDGADGGRWRNLVERTLPRALMGVGLVLLLTMRAGTHPDLWWQLSDGESLLARGTIPVAEPDSFTANSLHHRAPVHYLSAAVMAIGSDVGGLTGLLTLGVILPGFGLLFLGDSLSGSRLPVFLLLTTAVLAGIPVSAPTDRAFGLLFLAFLVTVGETHAKDRGRLAWAPVILTLWAASSPTVLLGFLILACWIVAAFLRRDDRLLPALGLALLTSLLGLVITPAGPATVSASWTRLATGMTFPSPPALSSESPEIFLGLWFILWLLSRVPVRSGTADTGKLPSTDAVERESLGAGDLPPALLLPLAAADPELGPFFVMASLPGLARRLPRFDPPGATAWLGGIVIVLGLLLPLSSLRIPESELARPCRRLRTLPARGNLFHDIAWGGFLARVPGVRPPFITTDRPPFTNGVLEDYSRMITGRSLELFDVYGIDTVLVDRRNPLKDRLKGLGTWQVLEEDGSLVLLHRWSWAAGGIPDHIEIPVRPR